jgi:alcohol dehydrogenase class IV
MFSFISPQSIHFGRGQSQQTAALAKSFGEAALLVHGASARRAEWLIKSCQNAGLTTKTISCQSEPSLPDIELALAQLEGFHPNVVIALGGGSVIDFAKALAALMRCSGRPLDYLEIVGGGKPIDHPPIPMIALPTTAGTGSEVTKNAVITVPEHSIKVSLRDPRMVPDIAIIDAALMQGAPQRVALTAGLDAVVQVIEPYLSVKANPMTDAICHAAIPIGLKVLRDLVENDAPEAWDSMAWVSTCGGLALANSGLGAVHGFAGVIGGKSNAPHGEICGALLPAVLESHLRKAEGQTETHKRLQWILDLMDTHFAQSEGGMGISGLRRWSTKMGLRGLEDMGLSVSDFSEVVTAASKASSMKGNPFSLSVRELLQILQAAK